jgi:hypothetical protein
LAASAVGRKGDVWCPTLTPASSANARTPVTRANRGAKYRLAQRHTSTWRTKSVCWAHAGGLQFHLLDSDGKTNLAKRYCGRDGRDSLPHWWRCSCASVSVSAALARAKAYSARHSNADRCFAAPARPAVTHTCPDAEPIATGPCNPSDRPDARIGLSESNPTSRARPSASAGDACRAAGRLAARRPAISRRKPHTPRLSTRQPCQ